MAGKIATRAAYGKALVEFAEKYPELMVLDADLAMATQTKDFRAAYPNRFFDCGIAENNMVGIAAGMAASGLKPFTNTFAIFAAGRSYEQIRNSVAYPHLNVKVVGSHGGISVGEDGATHQCTEDLALMRQIPGMTVLCPCDGHEMRLAVEALLNYDGPAYLRLARSATEIFTDELEGYKFELGKGVTIAEGKDVTERYALNNAVTYELDTVNSVVKVLAKVFLYIGIGFALFAALLPLKSDLNHHRFCTQ